MKKLLEIKNIHTKVKDLDKQILKGLDLTVNKGEIHVIMGPNGAGKSTLANTIFNNPEYEKTEGTIIFDGKDITNEKVNNIAKAGIFMSFQTPEEIPGITVAQFLKSAKQNVSEEKVNLYNFSKEVEDFMNKLSIPTKNTTRDLNVGFSGGEKKKNEILQMLVLNPKLAILDETDSGLDVDAVKIVSDGIQMYKDSNKDNAVLEAISEEIRKSRSIEEITEMYYDLQSIATNTNTMVAMGEYVLEHTGFDVDDNLSMLQFKLYFAKATEFIKSCMPSVQQSKEEMKKPESVAAFKTFVNIFHSLVERDKGNKNNLGK